MRPLLLLCPLLWACESPAGIRFPSSAQRFTPPAVYREWWARTEACSGGHASFDAVAWYVVPDAWTLSDVAGAPLGAWFVSGNRIVLAGNVQEWGDLVRHEMLHAILGPPAGRHPRDTFIQRCGGVVECDQVCSADGGPARSPVPNARFVAPTALDVAVEVVPIAASGSVLGGHFTMIITVRNAATYPVIVQLPPSGDAGPSGSFSYRIEGSGVTDSYDARAWEPEVTRFGGGETKQFLFDLHNRPGPTRFDLAPGTWRFNGAYGDVWAAAAPTVTIGP